MRVASTCYHLLGPRRFRYHNGAVAKMEAPFLVGEKVYLRPLGEGDLDRCWRWINDPEVRRYLGAWRPMSREQEQEWLRNVYTSPNNVQLAIVLREGNRHIGNLGLHGINWRSGSSELGILIGEPELWGWGYGPEAIRLLLAYAFDTLRLNRVELRVHAYNTRAIRAYEKSGFREEGRLRAAHFLSGRYHDTLVMALLASEWHQRARDEQS